MEENPYKSPSEAAKPKAPQLPLQKSRRQSVVDWTFGIVTVLSLVPFKRALSYVGEQFESPYNLLILLLMIVGLLAYAKSWEWLRK